jgi:dienelactone hydrolase
MPEDPAGIVVFAHGSGSSRFSPRNRFVAQVLNKAGFATLLFDLLTRDEHRLDERTLELRFDIELLSDRLIRGIDWVTQTLGDALPLGLFGASTGAAAALVAAANRPDRVGAIVSRGGRPDLAGDALRNVRAPTLLVVGSLDLPVLELNRQAALKMRAEHLIEIVEGASHLFEEPGALEEVARLARAWFHSHLTAPQRTGAG